MIKYITCLGCDKAFEVKPFIKHTRDCRLSNQVPFIDGFKYWKTNDFNDSSSDLDDDESRNDIRNSNYQILVKQTSASQTRGSRITSTPLHSDNKMFSVKSNPNLLRGDKTRKKLNRDRVNSQIYQDQNENKMDVTEFLEHNDEPSVSATEEATQERR